MNITYFSNDKIKSNRISNFLALHIVGLIFHPRVCIFY